MTQPPYPAIHAAANARAERLEAEAAGLRAAADELLSAIDALCGPAEAGPPTRRQAPSEQAA